MNKKNKNFPLEVFADKIQQYILWIVSTKKYNLEFLAASLLSAVASAIGNSLMININNMWITVASLYMTLVGKPGLGKTPPLSEAYAPLHQKDAEYLAKFIKELAYIKAQGMENEVDKPTLTKTIISDFTEEAMLYAHYINPRGITIKIDEIIALFKSINRYSKSSPLVEDLLSAWSGQPVDCIRKGETIPIVIRHPCINIIGTIQTSLLAGILNAYKDDGLMDRFMFVYPIDQKLPYWNVNNSSQLDDNRRQYIWKEIIDKLFGLKCVTDAKGDIINSQILSMTPEATLRFCNWKNSINKGINNITDERLIETRETKLDNDMGRLALVLQAMNWAAGEATLDNIELKSVDGAIKLVDYFEDCYYRLKEAIGEVVVNKNNTEKLLAAVPKRFKTGKAVEAGVSVGIQRSTVYQILKKADTPLAPNLHKVKHGLYEIVSPSE